MKNNNGLSPGQIRVIRQGIKLGRKLQGDHPEIAEMYRKGEFLQEIVDELDIPLKYGVKNSVAKGGVRNHISGHNGSFDIDAYDGSIPDPEERERLAVEHNRAWGSISYDGNIGIHGHKRTAEQKVEASRKGGHGSYVKGRGIHGRTSEQKVKDGIEGAISQGRVPWIEARQVDGVTDIIEIISEIEYAYHLSQNPDFQWRNGKPNILKILVDLNDTYHHGEDVRTRSSLYSRLFKYKKSLGGKVD